MVNKTIIRIFVFLLCFSMSVSIIACGKKDEKGTEEFCAYQKEIAQEEIVEENEVYYASAHVLLTSKPEVSLNDVKKLVDKIDGEIDGYISTTNDYQVKLNEKHTYQGLQELVAKLQEEEIIQEAMIMYMVPLETETIGYTQDPWMDTGTDPEDQNATWDIQNPGGNNWWAEVMNLPAVWEENPVNHIIKVGIIDTMFDLDHPDLDEGVFVKTWNNPDTTFGKCRVCYLYGLYKGVVDAYKEMEVADKDVKKIKEAEEGLTNTTHGTHVAGIIASQAGNGSGITGMNPKVQLYGYAMFSEETAVSKDVRWGNIFLFKCAIASLLNEGVKVINISMGFNDYLTNTQEGDEEAREWTYTNSRTMEAFLLKYIDAGNEFLIVKSAGNDSSNEVKYDVKYDIFGAIENERVSERIIIVGAAQYSSKYKMASIADFSNQGSRVDVYAPGVDILSAFPAENASIRQGTSQATPMVTGLCSLIWGINPTLSPVQVKNIIKASAHLIDEEIYTLGARDALEETMAKLMVNEIALPDANMCMQLAQNSLIVGSDVSEPYGMVMGTLCAMTESQTGYLDCGVSTITLYDENGEEVRDLDLTDLELENVATLKNYTELVLPGTYTLEAKLDGYEPQIKQITVKENDIIQLDFVFYQAPDPKEDKEVLLMEETYDAEGTMTEYVEYEYNTQGLLETESLWRFQKSQGESDWKRIQRIFYEYDEKGNKIKQSFEGGKIYREYSYDEEGRLLCETGTDNAGNIQDTYTCEYDERGNLIREINRWFVDGKLEFQETLCSVYDEDDHLQYSYYEEFPDSKTTFTYDEEWKLIQKYRIYGDMKITTTYTYDEGGRLVMEQELVGDWDPTTITYTYTENGQTLSCMLSDGTKLVYKYGTY